MRFAFMRGWHRVFFHMRLQVKADFEREQHQQRPYRRAKRHRGDAAEDDGDVQHHHPAIGLGHQRGKRCAAEFAANQVVPQEREGVAREQRGERQPQAELARGARAGCSTCSPGAL